MAAVALVAAQPVPSAAWSECDSLHTYSSPAAVQGRLAANPPPKPTTSFNDARFTLDFTPNATVKITGVFAHVRQVLPGKATSIYFMSYDFPFNATHGATYHAGQMFHQEINWFNPAVFPAGHYTYKFFIHGTNRTNFACL